MGGYARNLYSRSRVKEPRGKTLLSYRMAANPPSTCAHPLHPLQSMSETEERLAFEVLGASSEDPNHPAQNLLQYSEDGRGGGAGAGGGAAGKGEDMIDGGIRKTCSLEGLSALKPVFVPKGGTTTAGACVLYPAACVLLLCPVCCTRCAGY